MCKIVEELREEARIEAKRQTALSMIEDGKLSFEDIAKYSGLTLEEVKALTEGKPA